MSTRTRWSITRRLTLHYVASTAALLLLAGGFLYWTLKGNLEHSLHGLLTSKTEVLRVLLREQPDKAVVLASEVEHEASESHPFKYYVRILDPKDAVWLETPGMDELPPMKFFPAPVHTGANPLEGMQRTEWQGRSLLLLSVLAPYGQTGRELRTLQMALDVSSGAALLQDYRNKLLAVLGLSFVFAALAGVWIARRGMRPLVQMARTAQQITATHLHERITASEWPAELGDLAAALDAMLERLEDSFTRLSQSAADLAHELRTPINNLRGEAEVALTRTRTPVEYQQILESSLEEYERLSRMIEGLLFLARADNQKAAVERVRFEAGREIDIVREFYEALAGEKGIEIRCEGDAELTGDPALFRRAVSNLLANAIQHTEKGGTVEVSVRALSDQTVELEVCDTGRGIAPEHLPKIFERFYRGGHSRAEVPGGTGLGLAIVQSIARLHGGTAIVESELGKGTTVRLNFPATRVD